MALELAGAAGVMGALVAVVVASGLIGRRRRSIQMLLVWIGPLYSLAILAYFLFEGAGSECGGTGATFHCWEVSYASDWGLQGSLIVGVLILVSFAPIVSVRMRSRTPSVVAAIVMPMLIAIFLVGLWPWAPAWAAVLGAAIAGPPSRETSTKGTAGLRV